MIVYDVERHTFLSVPGLASQSSFDTFPSFSPDGKSLFYCTAPACLMPDSIGKLAYSLCCISFDPESGTFGSQVDTLFDARANGKAFLFQEFLRMVGSCFVLCLVMALSRSGIRMPTCI